MIIFLYGEDEFRSARKLAEIKEKFLEKNKEGGTLFVFDCLQSSSNMDEFMSNLSSGGLFSNKRLAIFKNILGDKKLAGDANLFAFLKRVSAKGIRDLTIIFWEREKFEKKAKLGKFLLTNSKSQEFNFLEGVNFLDWIKREVERKSLGKVGISPDGVHMLATFVGSENLFLLDCELEKLVGHRGKGEITTSDIEILVRSRISTDIFKTIDALSNGRKEDALRLLHEHLSRGDDPFYLLSMYFYQFRNLLKIKPLSEKHVPENEIAKKLKIHPYVVKKGVGQGRNFSLGKLKGLYKELCEIDGNTKTGKMDIKLAMDRFVANI